MFRLTKTDCLATPPPTPQRDSHAPITRKPRPALSPSTRTTLDALGKLLKAARLERRMVQQNLATRLGVSRHTVMAIKRGDPAVAIGTVLEAAAVLGVPLMADDSRDMTREAEQAKTLLPFLPARGRQKAVRLDDDF